MSWLAVAKSITTGAATGALGLVGGVVIFTFKSLVLVLGSGALAIFFGRQMLLRRFPTLMRMFAWSSAARHRAAHAPPHQVLAQVQRTVARSSLAYQHLGEIVAMQAHSSSSSSGEGGECVRVDVRGTKAAGVVSADVDWSGCVTAVHLHVPHTGANVPLDSADRHADDDYIDVHAEVHSDSGGGADQRRSRSPT